MLLDQQNRAQGQAAAIMYVARASAEGIEITADAMNKPGGERAVSFKIAEQYVQEFGKMAKESNTMILGAQVDDPSKFVLQAMNIFKTLENKNKEVK